MLKNITLVLCAVALLTACEGKVETHVSSTPTTTDQPQREPARGEPTDQVADFDNMVIYAIVVNPTPNPGKTYMYWVRDNSDRGWMFVTDKKYNIGDRLAIVQVPSLPASSSTTTYSTTDSYQ